MSASTKLRANIRRSGIPISRIARRAGVAITTLHSFMQKDGAEMRASSFEKVVTALAALSNQDAASNTGARGRAGGVREDTTAFDAVGQVRVEVPVPADRLLELRARGVDVEAVARAGAERALKDAEAKAWTEANRDAIDASRVWVEKYGTFAEQLGLI